MKQTIYISGLLLLAVACTPKLPKESAFPQTRQLSGIYVSHDEQSLIDTLEFIDWRRVQLMPEYLPYTSYFISGDSLFVETDKAFLHYRIINDSLLKGLSFWVEGDTLKAVPPLTIPKSHLLTAEDVHWLKINRRFHGLYYQPASFNKLEEVLTPLLDNFRQGHARSGQLYAQINLLQSDTSTAISYLSAACTGGFFHACFQRGELAESMVQLDSARHYFALGCEMGHTASCMMMEMMEHLDD